jgi:imidazolonepropionase
MKTRLMKTRFKNARFYKQTKTADFVVDHEGLIQNSQAQADQEIDLGGRLVLPGFVECHTHTVFGGSRGFEMEMKFQGQSYQEISQSGGGILSTVQATREISVHDLKVLNQKRIQNFINQGVTTLEIKSGYGLDLETEIKMLESIPMDTGIEIVRTFLGAHAKPVSAKSHADYLIDLAENYLPEIKKRNLAERVDIFVENGFFEYEDAKKYLSLAKSLGFDLTIHADQLSLSGGTKLACELHAKSADHCIQISDQEILALAKSRTVAVLLPAADLYLKCAYPPARKLINAGVQVALSTDFNPGTSPTQDLALVGMLARREMKMTLDEVVQAYTVGAASALGRQNRIGKLMPGYQADFTVWDIPESDLFLKIGDQKPVAVYKLGRQLQLP